ncbi:hypothetical protein EG865_15435, partial [Enterococcus faecalis]
RAPAARRGGQLQQAAQDGAVGARLLLLRVRLLLVGGAHPAVGREALLDGGHVAREAGGRVAEPARRVGRERGVRAVLHVAGAHGRGEARDARRHVLGDVVADVELRPHVAEEGGGRALPEGRAAHGRRGVRDVDGVQVLAEPRAV